MRCRWPWELPGPVGAAVSGRAVRAPRARPRCRAAWPAPPGVARRRGIAARQRWLTRLSQIVGALRLVQPLRLAAAASALLALLGGIVSARPSALAKPAPGALLPAAFARRPLPASSASPAGFSPWPSAPAPRQRARRRYEPSRSADAPRPQPASMPREGRRPAQCFASRLSATDPFLRDANALHGHAPSAVVLKALGAVAGRFSMPTLSMGSGCWPAARAISAAPCHRHARRAASAASAGRRNASASSSPTTGAAPPRGGQQGGSQGGCARKE